MKKGIAFVAYIHKTGVETRHQLFDFCYVDVAHRERGRAGLVLILHEVLVLEQSYRDFFLTDVMITSLVILSSLIA